MHTPQRAKGRANGHSFVALPHHLLEHPAFLELSGYATKALLLLAAQYKGKNNGDLCATQELAARSGWTSKGSFHRALVELEAAGFIVKTRQGGRNRCSLYALAWKPIDECGGKLDVPASRVASNEWLHGRKSHPPVGQLAPPVGQSALPDTPSMQH